MTDHSGGLTTANGCGSLWYEEENQGKKADNVRVADQQKSRLPDKIKATITLDKEPEEDYTLPDSIRVIPASDYDVTDELAILDGYDFELRHKEFSSYGDY